MAGNRETGLAATKTMKQKYGDDYFVKLGAKGGSAYKTKPHGFMTMSPEKRSAAGRKGGVISKRGKAYSDS